MQIAPSGSTRGRGDQAADSDSAQVDPDRAEYLGDKVRGKGMLNGIELKKDAGDANRYVELLLKEGVLCKDTAGQVIRITPPLTITEMPDQVVWLPLNSPGSAVHRQLGVTPGAVVNIGVSKQ